MPWHCGIQGCAGRSNRKNGVAIHSFPNCKTLEEQWLYFVVMSGGTDKLGKESGVCSRHFTDDDYTNIQQYKMGYSKVKRLKRDAVPSRYADENGEIQSIQKIENRKSKESSAFQVCVKKYRSNLEKFSTCSKQGQLGRPKFESPTKIEKKKQEKQHKRDRRLAKRRKPREVKNQDDAVSSSSVTTEFQQSIAEIPCEQTTSEPSKTNGLSKEKLDEVMLSPVGDILFNVQRLSQSKFLTISKSVKSESQNRHLKELETEESSNQDETFYPSSTSSKKPVLEDEEPCRPDTSLCSVRQSDYAEFFGNMIAQRLRNLSPVRCAEAQVKMLQALIDVENGSLNELDFEPADDLLVSMAGDTEMNAFPAEIFLSN